MLLKDSHGEVMEVRVGALMVHLMDNLGDLLDLIKVLAMALTLLLLKDKTGVLMDLKGKIGLDHHLVKGKIGVKMYLLIKDKTGTPQVLIRIKDGMLLDKMLIKDKAPHILPVLDQTGMQDLLLDLVQIQIVKVKDRIGEIIKALDGVRVDLIKGKAGALIIQTKAQIGDLMVLVVKTGMLMGQIRVRIGVLVIPQDLQDGVQAVLMLVLQNQIKDKSGIDLPNLVQIRAALDGTMVVKRTKTVGTLEVIKVLALIEVLIRTLVLPDQANLPVATKQLK